MWHSLVIFQIFIEWSQCCQLHDEHERVGLADANQAHDVTMLQRRHHLRFALDFRLNMQAGTIIYVQ